MTKALAVIGNLLALFGVGAGLISPLTPSEGMPSIMEVLTWVGIPLILLLLAWRTYSSKPAKIGVVTQALAIVGFTVWLLLLQSGVLSSGS